MIYTTGKMPKKKGINIKVHNTINTLLDIDDDDLRDNTHDLFLLTTRHNNNHNDIKRSLFY